MRVMLDTNILISALLFPSEQIELFFQTVTERNTVVLSSYVVQEFHHVIQRKFPHRQEDADRFLSHFAFELVYTPEFLETPLIPIRDAKDYPVLHSALTENIDVLVTGDKDFTVLELEYPEILTLTEFLEKYRA